MFLKPYKMLIYSFLVKFNDVEIHIFNWVFTHFVVKNCRTSQHVVNQCIIPYLGVFLIDLTLFY